MSSVLGTFGLFAVRRGWLALLASCFARVRYARRVRRVLCIRSARAVDVFRPFGVFGLICAFDAINLLSVLNAFELFVVYSVGSACLVRLVRFALVRSTSWVYFCCYPCSVCAVWVGVRVGVAVGAVAPVDVAVGGHVDVTAFFASRVDIGTCVNVFLCFGRLELLRYGLRRRVRA